jgi:hypothetical protein
MLHFTPQDWERVERDTVAWWEGELERPLVYLSSTDPLPDLIDGPTRYSYLSNYPLDMPAEAVIDRHAPVVEATRYYGDAFPQVWTNFGPGIMAGFLGSVVHSVTDPSETVWFTPAKTNSLEDLTLAYDASNAWWKRVQTLTHAIVQRWNGQVAVGHTDLGGNLDILASLRDTQQLLFDVIDAPDEVERLVHQISALWIRYYDELDRLIRGRETTGRAAEGAFCRGTSCWTPLWSPGKTYMLQCDFSYMISPIMFERFVVPDLVTCCDYLDHGFYHLDGKGEIPHLDHLLSIARLRGIQWVPGDGAPPPQAWLDLLKRIRDGGKLCQVFVSTEGARTIAKNLGGRGFFFVINHAWDEFHDPERARAFLKTLAQEDISLQH